MDILKVYAKDKKVYIDLKIEDITMIESFKRGTNVYTLHGVYETGIPMKEILISLKLAEFCQTHRKYVVALQHVKHIEDKSVKVSSGYEAEISRRLKTKFLEQYEHWMINQKIKKHGHSG
jgi:DNA-binding LytR/AlgR family response regulator